MRKVYILLGPTASGKSSAVTSVVSQFPNILQVINCDSKQVYKEIPIITAQPHHDEITKYSYKLYGYRSILDHYDVTNWLSDAKVVIEEAFEDSKIPLLVGGTGFYINALINGLSSIPPISDNVKTQVFELIESYGSDFYEYFSKLDNKIIGKIEKNDSYRLTKAAQIFFETNQSIFDFHQQKTKLFEDVEFVTTVLLPQRDLIYANISKRFDNMIQNGVLVEAYKLYADGKFDKNNPSFKAHGFPEIIDYYETKIELQDAIELAKKNTRHYAKRQTTWFKHQIEEKIVFEELTELEKFLIDEFKVF
jgi:tRNA dimethylallyltransferase